MKSHAVLLANFFNYVDSQNGSGNRAVSYIVLGKSILEGYAAQVLRKNDIAEGHKDAQHIELWNPLTAECYTLNKKLTHSDMAFFKENV